MGAQGTALLDFGAFPGSSHTTVAVTGQAGIVASSLVEAWIRPEATADHTADEHMVETLRVEVPADSIVAGVGFTIHGFNTNQLNEPLAQPGISTFRSAAATVYGSPGAPSVGGRGTFIWGRWTIAWVWN